MTLAARSSQFAYAGGLPGTAKYSRSRSGRNRNKNVGSVNSNGERQDMLARQRLVDFREPESFRFDFRFDLGHAHLVLGADRNRRVFLAIFEEDETTVWLQRLPKALQHRLGLGQLVIHV